MHRRDWLYAAASGASALALTAVLGRLPVRRQQGLRRAGLLKGPGPLALPEGFRCMVLSRAGQPMTDGVPTPGLPDGMACFLGPAGEWILARNHEVGRDPRLGGFPSGQPSLAYDAKADGGVSRLVLDPETLRIRSSNMVLTGTLLNCSGGPSPLGYLTCEETEEAEHGWVFLCDPSASRLEPAKPVHGYGRFRHEAVATNPHTLQAYLTEDQADGCLYRFTPASRAEPLEGVLEFAKAVGTNHLATATSLRVGDAVAVAWEPVPEPTAKAEPLRVQCARLGALTVRRGEGIWFDAARDAAFPSPSVIFSATTGGPSGRGQIFRLHLAPSGDRLEVIAEAPAQHGLQFPDNITVAPWGDPIVAEDGVEPQHIVGIRRDGSSYAIAQNVVSASEFAGVCFSPDGSTLFCNLQKDGLTLAIRGPWAELERGARA